ncbi:MAG: hypothetical protein JXB50_12630 [Spirochaetes bacterium]|nr:hypothetical protein [Spirochaetota bacterium]
MKKRIFLLFLSVFFIFGSKIFPENLYLGIRGTFANAQFWELQQRSYPLKYRNVYSNFFSGSVGFQVDFTIWDIGKKRGSRIFFKNGIDYVLSGLNFIGAYNVAATKYTTDSDAETGNAPGVMYALYDDGALYTGLSMDTFIGGTFPLTDLNWGFGCIFNFMFPVYSPANSVTNFTEKFHFYAVPSILLAYDIFLPNNNFKITPQLRAGFTCLPMIPNDLLNDTVNTKDNNSYVQSLYFSGFYADISVAFSFHSIQWKK